MLTISCSRAETVPKVCQRMGARSGKDSRFLDSSRRTDSRWSGLVSWRIRMWRSSIVSAALVEGSVVLLLAGVVVEEDGVMVEVPPSAPSPPTWSCCCCCWGPPTTRPDRLE